MQYISHMCIAVDRYSSLSLWLWHTFFTLRAHLKLHRFNMPASTTSLLEYLRVDNPPLKCRLHSSDSSGGASQKNTTNGNWKTPDVIQMWEDFDFDTLQTSYGGVLQTALDQQPYNLPVHSGIAPFPFCEIHDEDSLNALLVKWNQSMVSDALVIAQDFLQGHLGLPSYQQVFMVRGGQADYPASSATLRPDWAGVQRVQFDASRARNILPGDTKVGGKWSSCNIEVGPVADAHMANDWIEPIKQVYSYCLKTESRYGYIITEKELVVVRIRPATEGDFISPDNSQETYHGAQPSTVRKSKFLKSAKQPPSSPSGRISHSGMLEYKAIPWKDKSSLSIGGQQTLTVNLALWWLHLMASENNSIKDTYPPLPGSSWNPQTTTANDGSKRRKHDLFRSDGESDLEDRGAPRRRTRQQTKSWRTDDMSFTFEQL